MVNIIEKLKTQIRGYSIKQLNLLEFIEKHDLSLILNNNLISNDNFYFELDNYTELLEIEEEEIKENLTDYFTIEELEELDPEELEEEITEKASENIYCSDIYQYFIIPEYEAKEYWSEHTNYPIYADYEHDIYLLGITHYGMSWKFFKTDCYIKEYI